MQVAKRAQPRRLQRLIGVETTPEHPDGKPHVAVAIPANELRERLEIAAKDVGDERRI